MSKFSIMLVAAIAVGVFALPAVISTFGGSHAYVAGENVECLKCHEDVYPELESSQTNHTHANLDWIYKQVLDCDECHTVSGIDASADGGHAAQKVDCAYCHDKNIYDGGELDYRNWAHDFYNITGLYYEYGMPCDSCHRTDYDHVPRCKDSVDCHTANLDEYRENMFLDDVYENIAEITAAHYSFYDNAMNDDTLLGGTEACIACHTHVEVNFTQPLGTYNIIYDPSTGKFGKE